MEPQGIRVVEISLSLSNAFYYIHWTPASVQSRETPHRPLQAAHGIGLRFGWKILAGRVCPDPDGVQLLFATTSNNLEQGLAPLLGGAAHHRLYLVQPDEAVRRVTHHIRQGGDSRLETAASGGEQALPEIHYGLFMGSRTWAEDMLNRLSRDEPEPAPRRAGRHSLVQISRDCSNRRDAVTKAYRTREFSLKDIAEFFDMHFSEVSAIVNQSSLKSTGGAP